MNFFRQKVIAPVQQAFSAGLTPHHLTLTLTLAVTHGLIPLPGLTGLFCLAVAIPFGLNTPLMQAINLMLTPIDLALCPPFMRLGEKVLRLEPLPLSPSQLWGFLKEQGFRAAIGTVMQAAGCAVLGWAIVMTPVGFAIYYALKPVVTKVLRKKDALRSSESDVLLGDAQDDSFGVNIDDERTSDNNDGWPDDGWEGNDAWGVTESPLLPIKAARRNSSRSSVGNKD
ncbi:hypothetical protein BC832DRAFT_545146, partial [Gaertneriomyces semiglobifer]